MFEKKKKNLQSGRDMNDIELLEKTLNRDYPNIVCYRVDPITATGSHWLDLKYKDKFLTVKWEDGEFSILRTTFPRAETPGDIFLSVHKTVQKISEILQVKKSPLKLTLKNRILESIAGVGFLFLSYFRGDHFED